MITEPHTFDPEPEQEPDCATACADALLTMVEYLGKASRHPTSAMVRIATMQVVVGRMNATDAAACYKIARSNIYRHAKAMAEALGLEYIKGDIKATTPPSKESLRRQ